MTVLGQRVLAVVALPLAADALAATISDARPHAQHAAQHLEQAQRRCTTDPIRTRT